MLASEENNNKQGHTVKVLQTFKRISREQTKSKCIKHPIIFYSLIASLIGSVVVLAISAIIFSEYQVKIKKDSMVDFLKSNLTINQEKPSLVFNHYKSLLTVDDKPYAMKHIC